MNYQPRILSLFRDTEYNIQLEPMDYLWVKFIAPQTAEYIRNL